MKKYIPVELSLLQVLVAMKLMLSLALPATDFDTSHNVNIDSTTQSPSVSPVPASTPPKLSNREFPVVVLVVTLLVCVFIVLPAFLFAFLYCGEYPIAAGDISHNSNEQRPPPNPTPTSTTSSIVEDQKRNRRNKVLSSIIHKKVFSKRNLLGNMDEDSDEKIILLCDTAQRPNQTHMMANAPSSHSICSNNEALSSSIFPIAVPHANNEQEEEGAAISNNDLLKDDIYMENLRNSHKSQRLKMTNRSSLYSPKNCPICLEEYNVGDEIAWSNNQECPHAFHLDCIVNWLMNNDDCPLCRADYLNTDENC